jgi:hypothetical protein
MHAYERLTEEFSERKGELLVDKRAQIYSVYFKFHMPGLGLKSGLHHETLANKRLDHGMINYGVGFSVNGIRS